MAASGSSRAARASLAWLAAACGLVVAPGCGGSQILLDWHEPSFSGPPLRKVLVVAVKNDPTRRRIWEDTLSRALAGTGAEAVASYRLFPDALPDTAAVVATVRAQHFDGLLVTHRVNTEQVNRVIPGGTTLEATGVVHDPFYGSYDTVYRQVDAPDLVETDQIVRDRTDLWEVRGTGRLVYQGYTESTNPESATELSRELTQLVVPRLRKAHLF